MPHDTDTTELGALSDLIETAFEHEEEVIRDVARRAHLLWQCPKCGCDTPTGQWHCDGCGAALVDVCRPGDPDPTPGTWDETQLCGAAHPEEGWQCTRWGVHPGGVQHVAGGDGVVTAAWKNPR